MGAWIMVYEPPTVHMRSAAANTGDNNPPPSVITAYKRGRIYWEFPRWFGHRVTLDRNTRSATL